MCTSSDLSPWLRFKHPDVRDLAFVLACPPLLEQLPNHFINDGKRINQAIDLPNTSFWQTLYQYYIPRLIQLEQNPEALIKVLAQTKSTRLGLRFEALLYFWLLDDAWHPFKLIERSIQIIENKTTLGEIDFLIQHQETKAIEHWEVTLKFYLGEYDLSPDHWLGLNRKDTLGRKLRHIMEYQFNTQSIIVNNTDYKIETRRAIIKGRFFYPIHTPVAIKPSWCNKQQLVGTWGLAPPCYAQYRGLNFRRASRPEWITERDDYPAPAYLTPPYWTDGLYFGLNRSGDIAARHIVRLPCYKDRLTYKDHYKRSMF